MGRDEIDGVVGRVVGMQIPSLVVVGLRIRKRGMVGEVSEAVNHAHVAANHTGTVAGRSGDGLPSGVVGGVVGHRAPHPGGMGHCPLEKNGVRAYGDVFRASEGGDASGRPDAVVAVHHRRCWRISDHGFSVVQRFFVARPGVHEVKVTDLRHQHH